MNLFWLDNGDVEKQSGNKLSKDTSTIGCLQSTHWQDNVKIEVLIRPIVQFSLIESTILMETMDTIFGAGQYMVNFNKVSLVAKV